jgi:hypothetical protein
MNYFLQIWRARKIFIGIGLTTLLPWGFGRITTRLGKIEFKMLYFYLNIKILFFIILTDYLFLPYRLYDFWYDTQKNTLKKRVFQAGKTRWFGGISNLCTFQRLYGKIISRTWCGSISCNGHTLVRRTRTRRFMVQLPRRLVDQFYLFCMRSAR